MVFLPYRRVFAGLLITACAVCVLITRWIATEIVAPAFKSIRLACFVVCRKTELHTKVKAVNVTWGRRCDKMLYVMTWQVSSPDILPVSIPDTYGNLNTKSVYAFTYLYNTSLYDFDWFLKADDDTYVIVENLRFLLAQLNKNEPAVLGDHFRHFGPNGFMSGGAGYVLSQAGLKRLVEKGYNIPGRCWTGPGKEDVEMGRCLTKAGVSVRESIDVFGKGAFHAASPYLYLSARLPRYLQSHMVYDIRPGLSCCSNLTISFHYVSPQDMMLMELLLYNLHVVGTSYDDDKLHNFFRQRLMATLPKGLPRKPFPGESLSDYYQNFAAWKNSLAKEADGTLAAESFKLSLTNQTGYYMS